MKLTLPRLSIPKITLPSIKAKSSKSALAIQYTDKVIRLLELDSNKKPKFEPVEVSIEGKDKGEVLRGLAQRLGLQGKDVVACLPANEGLLKVQRFPASLNDADLRKAIDWSIKKELSSFREEMTYDYHIMERIPEEKNRTVILIFSRKETVENIKKTIESAGMKLAILDYEVLALINYGLYHNIPKPFSILYIDYDYAVLTTYSVSNIAYSVFHWSYKEYFKNNDEEYLEGFFAEIRNIVILNDLSSMHIAGPVLMEEELVVRIMENVPVLGILDVENIKPNFFVPYILSIRGMEG